MLQVYQVYTTRCMCTGMLLASSTITLGALFQSVVAPLPLARPGGEHQPCTECRNLSAVAIIFRTNLPDTF